MNLSVYFLTSWWKMSTVLPVKRDRRRGVHEEDGPRWHSLFLQRSLQRVCAWRVWGKGYSNTPIPPVHPPKCHRMNNIRSNQTSEFFPLLTARYGVDLLKSKGLCFDLFCYGWKTWLQNLIDELHAVFLLLELKDEVHSRMYCFIIWEGYECLENHGSECELALGEGKIVSMQLCAQECFLSERFTFLLMFIVFIAK